MLDRSFTIALIVLLFVGCAKTPALILLQRRGDILPFEQVLAVARESFPDALLLDVKLQPNPHRRYIDRHYYEVELLNNRSRRLLKIDAHDGSVLEVTECFGTRRCPR